MWRCCRVQNEGSFFSMTGKLEEAWTGAASHAESAREHRKKKKRRAEPAADARCSSVASGSATLLALI